MMINHCVLNSPVWLHNMSFLTLSNMVIISIKLLPIVWYLLLLLLVLVIIIAIVITYIAVVMKL